jgi:hypothetical protein
MPVTLLALADVGLPGATTWNREVGVHPMRRYPSYFKVLSIYNVSLFNLVAEDKVN